jgi:hypothetical protein
MDHSNRNRVPAEFEGIEDALRAERHQASPLELDRIKLQAISQAERSRPSLKKGTFMKSRLALTLMLVAGFMLSTTGVGLAISGSSSSGSAASSQYVPSGTGGNHPEHEVKGVEEKGGKCVNGGSGNGGNGGNGGANGGNGSANGGGKNCTEAAGTSSEPAPEVEVAPAAAEQQAVVSEGSSLPFTGFVAIPLLVIGLGLIVVGAVVGLKPRKEPSARL